MKKSLLVYVLMLFNLNFLFGSVTQAPNSAAAAAFNELQSILNVNSFIQPDHKTEVINTYITKYGITSAQIEKLFSKEDPISIRSAEVLLIQLIKNKKIFASNLKLICQEAIKQMASPSLNPGIFQEIKKTLNEAFAGNLELVLDNFDLEVDRGTTFIKLKDSIVFPENIIDKSFKDLVALNKYINVPIENVPDYLSTHVKYALLETAKRFSNVLNLLSNTSLNDEKFLEITEQIAIKILPNITFTDASLPESFKNRLDTVLTNSFNDANINSDKIVKAISVISDFGSKFQYKFSPTNNEPTIDILKKVFEKLTFTNDNDKEISLFDLSIRKIFTKFSEGLIFYLAFKESSFEKLDNAQFKKAANILDNILRENLGIDSTSTVGKLFENIAARLNNKANIEKFTKFCYNLNKHEGKITDKVLLTTVEQINGISRTLVSRILPNKLINWWNEKFPDKAIEIIKIKPQEQPGDIIPGQKRIITVGNLGKGDSGQVDQPENPVDLQ